MPSMVVKLLGESQSLVSASNTGRTSIGQLDRSMDTLIATMQREQTVSSQGARQTQILALADKGASVAKVEYALALAGELDSLAALTAAEAVEAKKKQDQERATERATASRKAHRDALDMEYQSMLLMAGIATVGGTPVRTNAMGGVSQNHQQLKSFTAAFPGRDNMQDNIVMLQQQAYHEERLTRGIQLRNAAQQRLNQTTAGGAGAMRTNTLAVQALAFGVQDAAQVYGTTGLSGAISASANNLIFMTSLLNPQLAIFTAITVAAGQFASVLLPMSANSKKVGEETDRLTKIYEKHTDVLVTMAQKRRDFAMTLQDATTRDSAQSIVKQTKREGENLASEIAVRKKAIAVLEERRRKSEEKERRREEGATVGGSIMRAVWSVNEHQAEQQGIDHLIGGQRQKLNELMRQQKINAGQQVAAGQQYKYASQQQSMEETRKWQMEEKEKQSRLDSEVVRQQNEERAKGLMQFVKQRSELEKSLSDELRTEDEKKRLNTLQTLGERQSQIDQWVGEKRLSVEEGMTLKMQARQAASRSLLMQDQQAQLDPLQDRLKSNKKLLEDQTKEPGNQNLTAIEARSAEGMKKIFDAMGGGTDPQQTLVRNTHAMITIMKEQVTKSEALVDAIKKNKPVKTGGS